MQFIQKSDATHFTNSPTCAGYEYSFTDKDLNIAVVTVNGRYPESGYAMNEICKELGYVLSGSGSITIWRQEPQNLVQGDAVMIQPGEKFFWQGESLELLLPCSPAFYLAQYKLSR